MKSLSFAVVFISLVISVHAQTDALLCASELLEAARLKQPTENIQQQLVQMEVEDLATQLDNDNKRKAFWINVYNANIQLVLSQSPELFEDRRAFFSTPRITIAGKLLSFEDIEHGIIRRSQGKLTLGLIPKLFVDAFEKKMRVRQRDGRIHFALNCGAKSCPPVANYDAAKLDEQLDEMSKQFLKQYTRYESSEEKVYITALFNWFRGDFGGLKGVKSFLKSYNAIPADSNPTLVFDVYDWTLYLDNYVDL